MRFPQKIKFPSRSEGNIPMKVRRGCAAMVSLGTSILLLVGTHSSQASEIKIVSPSAYKYREGEGGVLDDALSPYRFQQVFPAADFAALGNRPHWIVGFTWRPDQSVTNYHTVQLPDQQIRLSTTQRGPENLSFRFDDNLGSDVTQFYRGSLSGVDDVKGPGPGPREFCQANFPAGVTPFLYDPSQGNLLIDHISWGGESPSGRVDQVPGIRTSLYVSNPLGTQGAPNAATIIQFTFVPVPELSNPAWSGGQFQFTLTGETNLNYVIQVSTNLQSWTPLTTNSSPNASRNITINAPNSRSFYRAVVGPLDR
jgi:hypothetical protein